MNGSWQIVPDENEDKDRRTPRSADLRRIAGLAVVLFVLAASTALMLDRSSLSRSTSASPSVRPLPISGYYVPGAEPLPPMTTVPSATPLPLAGALAPGTYFLGSPCLAIFPARTGFGGCSDFKWIIFTLPAGWAISDGIIFKHRHQPGEVAFSFWTVSEVYDDPCHWQGSTLSPLDIRPAQKDGGLAYQPGRNASAVTPVTLGRQRAFRIELSVSAQLDLATCDRGQFRSWPEWGVPDGANSHNAPGQIDVVYMVDVDRMALVIDASHLPATTEADLAELQVILASMVIER